MTNFNTNQTRHLYVAAAIDANVDTNLDINLAQAATGEMYFVYKNADGLVTRSDTFDPKKIVSLKKNTAAELATPLKAHTVAVDSAITLTDLIGKTVNCIITFHGVFDYDMDNTITVVASVVGNATNTASAAAFHKDLAIAITKVLPKFDKGYPYLKVFSNGTEVTAKTPASSVTGAAAGVVLVEAAQKYVRGKLAGEPVPFSVAFHLAGNNVEDVVWGTDTVANSAISGNTVVPANRVLADLEWFSLGERGDMYRGFRYPNDYTPTYAVDLTKDYSVLSIEYYWAGDAENVQKSPRLIQVAAPETSGSSTVINTLYDAVDAAMAGVASS